MKKQILLGLFLLAFLAATAQKVKHFEAFVTYNSGGLIGSSAVATRYVAVMDDNTMYWFSKEQTWSKIPTTGLPSDYDVIAMDAYSKEDGGRVIIILSDNSFWWYSTSGGWKPVPTNGLPEGKKIIQLSSYVKMDGTRYVVVLDDNTMWWYSNGKPWVAVPLEGLPK